MWIKYRGACTDHSTLSHFRSTLTEHCAYDKIFKEVNIQLEAYNIIIKCGAIVDASVIDTPLYPRGRTVYKVFEDRKDEQEISIEKHYPENLSSMRDFDSVMNNFIIDD